MARKQKRRRCIYCGILTHEWEIVNGGPVRCWDCGKKIREALRAKAEKKTCDKSFVYLFLRTLVSMADAVPLKQLAEETNAHLDRPLSRNEAYQKALLIYHVGLGLHLLLHDFIGGMLRVAPNNERLVVNMNEEDLIAAETEVANAIAARPFLDRKVAPSKGSKYDTKKPHRLTVGCRARIKTLKEMPTRKGPKFAGNEDHWRWGYGNREVLLLERSGTSGFSVMLLGKGVNKLKKKDPKTVENRMAWVPEDNLILVDTNFDENLDFIDWYQEHENYFCGDCGAWREEALVCPNKKCPSHFEEEFLYD